MGFGKIIVAKEIISKIIGKTTAPIILLFVFDSISFNIKSKHQLKNKSDSY